MKKFLVFLIALSAVFSLNASAKVNWGGDVSLGCEIFIEEKVIPEPSVTANIELPSVTINKRHTISLPLSYSFVSDFISVNRYRTIPSHKVSLGARYLFSISRKIELGIGYHGGFWFFDLTGFVYPTTVFHTLEARAVYNLTKHLSLALPVTYTHSSFGKTFGASVSLRLH